MAKMLLVTLVLVLQFQSYLLADTKNILYNSSDLSYLSNGIQFPAPSESAENNTRKEIPFNATVMESISRLFDHHVWEPRIFALPEGDCRKDLIVYLDNLKNDTAWAAKS